MSDRKFRRILFQTIALLFLLAGTFMLFCNQLKVAGTTFGYEIVLFGGVKHLVTFQPAVAATVGYICLGVFGIIGFIGSLLNGGTSRCVIAIAALGALACFALIFSTAGLFAKANVAYCADRTVYLAEGPILGGIFGSVGFCFQLISLTQKD